MTQKSVILKNINFFILFFSVTTLGCWAFAQDYQLVNHPDGSTGITMAVPYTAGVHEITANSVAGEAKADLATQSFVGQFIVPIDSMKSGNGKRDCHMRECLGLDYSKSKFPGEHVCDNNDALPASGNDGVAFPNVEFDLAGLKGTAGPLTLTPGKTEQAQASGRWTIHGLTKDVVVPATVTTAADGSVEVKIKETLLIADFKAVVKPVLGIGVNGDVKVSMDLNLKPK